MLSRRTLLAAGAFGLGAATDPAFYLIAHRGGIVDDQHAENSPGSIQAAIERGYWMIEVDIRRTKDGEPILQHDANFQRFYGDPRTVEEMSWGEIGRLTAQPGGTHPIHFRDVCRMCRGKLRLMLDIKGNDFPADFYQKIRALLLEHDLLRTAYLLGGGSRAAQLIGPGCFRSSNRKSLRAAVERGEEVKRNYFLFELASDLNQESFDLCRQHGVTPVAAINSFRYTEAKRDEWQGAVEDAARVKALGVRHFQIDSRYDSLFARK